MRVVNFWNNNYIEYERKNGRNKNLSVQEYLNKVKPYMGDIIIDLKKYGTWKVQLTLAINFVSPKRCRWRTCNALKEQQYKIYEVW